MRHCECRPSFLRRGELSKLSSSKSIPVKFSDGFRVIDHSELPEARNDGDLAFRETVSLLKKIGTRLDRSWHFGRKYT